MKGLIGTVAGDDTILCVASEETGGRGLASQLRALAGIDTKKGAGRG
jgi:arginine repressor